MKNRPPLPQHLSRHRYHALLVRLQIELVKLQRSVIERGQRILVIVEGRDPAGKDGTIKSIVEHLSKRDTRVVALGRRPIGSGVHGTSSVTFRTCPRQERLCCSIAVGTTVLELSVS